MFLDRIFHALAARLASASSRATLFVGSGNRFDDDRRLVRIAVPARPRSCADPEREP